MAALDNLHSFYRCSGLKINLSKTYAVNLGNTEPSDSNMKVAGLNWVDTLKILGLYISSNNKSTLELNFSAIIKDITSALNIWKSRNLTLIGRIQIVKWYGCSKLAYLGSVIDIPACKIKELENIFFRFIWNGTDKIKRSTLINNYDDGGLRMICLNSFLKSQKIMWVKRLLTSHSQGWKSILLHYLYNFGGLLLLYCNFGKDIFPNWMPQFYKSVLIVWSDLHNIYPIVLPHLSEIIWNNVNIQIGKKQVFIHNLFNKGFITISDILDNEGNMLSFEQLVNKNCSYHDYFNLVSVYNAIPHTWKRNIKASSLNADTPQQVTHNVLENAIMVRINYNRSKRLDDMSSKDFYNILLTKESTPPIVQGKLQRIFGYTGDQINYIFKLPFLTTIDSKTREFQFKITHDILPLNKWLYRVHLSSTNLCAFCKEEPETQLHFFVSCSFTKKFWKEVTTILNTPNFPELSPTVILYGFLGQQSNSNLINQIILTGKQVLYECKWHKVYPTTNLFLRRLGNIHSIEEFIAHRKGKMASHNRKWRTFHCPL